MIAEKQLSFPGPETITRRVLDNGIIVLARPNPASPSVVVRGLLHVGANDDPADKLGLANFTTESLDRGTATRTFSQINEAVEAVGASFGVGSGRHTASFGTKSLVDDLDLVLDITADVLRNPTFPPAEIEKVRGQLITMLQERENNTRAVADDIFRELAYPTHPYGNPADGTLESVRSITREDIETFYRQTFNPIRGSGPPMLVAIVGAIEPEAAIARIDKYFGGWGTQRQNLLQHQAELPPLQPITEIRRSSRGMPGKSQSDIVLGCHGIRRNDPDYLPASMANMILGVLGLMGRLGRNVRDEKGLAYYAASRLEARLGAGPWMAYAGVNPKNVDLAVDSILEEFRRMGEEPVTEQELSDAKAYLTGSMPLSLETNEGVAQTLLDLELYQLGLDYLQRYPDMVRAISSGEIQAVSQKYLRTDAYALAVAGPE